MPEGGRGWSKGWERGEGWLDLVAPKVGGPAGQIDVGGEPWLTAAITMANPYCSCKLTRVRSRCSQVAGRPGELDQGGRRCGTAAARTALQHDGPNHHGM